MKKAGGLDESRERIILASLEICVSARPYSQPSGDNPVHPGLLRRHARLGARLHLPLAMEFRSNGRPGAATPRERAA